MRIKRVEIEGYRSIKGKIELHVEPNVTVILGANDHGKTNILTALLHFNEGMPFDLEKDVSWDVQKKDPQAFPRLMVEVELDLAERKEILEQELNIRKAQPARAVPDGPIGSFVIELGPDLTIEEIAQTVRYERKGVGTEIAWSGYDGFDKAAVQAVLQYNRPRIELIQPLNHLSDSINAADLGQPAGEFMRGIFYYAGIDPKNAAALFQQNDETLMSIGDATERLNETLKASWSQGKELQFGLTHNSGQSSIELVIRDPSVTTRFVRASRRSSGFTHYFALKTVLHAREKDNPAKSYVWLFDEPGIYLHPSGQFDLLQVLETLGRENQVVYVTHSLFMINKTFPTRHRLVLKDKLGTTLESKPYVSRWGSVINMLGLSQIGTILFANHVLLTEGDTEPVLLPAVIQRLVELKQISFDLNPVSIVSTGDSRNAEAQIWTLMETRPTPKVGLLFDGDFGGKERFDDLRPLIERHALPHTFLKENHSIEDYLPFVGTVYVDAVAQYVFKLMQGKNAAPDLKSLRVHFRKSYDERAESQGIAPVGVAKWAGEEAKTIAKLRKTPSKIGIAREYVNLLMAVPDEQLLPAQTGRILELITWIREKLEVPQIQNVEAHILNERGR